MNPSLRLTSSIIRIVLFCLVGVVAEARAADPPPNLEGYVFRAPGGSLNGAPIDRDRFEITVPPGAAITGTIVVEANNLIPPNAVVPLGGTVTWGDRTIQPWLTNGDIPTGTNTFTVAVNKTAPAAEGDYHIVVAFGGEFTIQQVMSLTNWTVPGNPIWYDGNDIGFDWTAEQFDQAIHNGAVPIQVRYSDGFYPGWRGSTAVIVHVRAPEQGFCWEKRATPFAEGLPGIVFHNGKLWALGGVLYSGPTPYDSVHSDAIRSFDPSTGVWQQQQATLPYACVPMNEMLLGLGQTIYMSPQIGPGENNGWGTHNRLIEYDMTNDVAAETATYCDFSRIWNPTLIRSLSGTLYSLSGWNGGYVGAVYRHDGGACLTRLSVTLGANTSPMTGCLDAAGRYVSFGHRWAFSRVQIFDPQTESVVFTGDILPADMIWTQVSWLDRDGSPYVAGGYVGGVWNSKVYKFDSWNRTFTMAPFELPPQEVGNEIVQNAYDPDSGTLYLIQSRQLPNGTFESSLLIGTPGPCGPDCNSNGVPDDQDIANGTSHDCNLNGIPDECDIAQGVEQDCQPNAVPDVCDIRDGTSADGNSDGIPDECEAGACCDDAVGDCVITTANECTFRYGGDGSTCATIDPACEPPLLTGACCDDAVGDCIITTASECTFRYGGDGSTCATIDPVCEPPLLTGACCDTLNGVCSEGILAGDCIGDQRIWTHGASCAEVVCDPAPGACCDQDVFGTCTVTTVMECDCLKCIWHKLLACEDIECTHNPIPTVSHWGLVVLSLLLLTGAKVYFGRRQTETV
jgi:hypothetical protein